MKKLLIGVALAGVILAGCDKASSLTPEQCMSKAAEIERGLSFSDEAKLKTNLEEIALYYNSAARRGHAEAMDKLVGMYALYGEILGKDESTYLKNVKKAIGYKIDWAKKNNKERELKMFEEGLANVEKNGVKGVDALLDKLIRSAMR